MYVDAKLTGIVVDCAIVNLGAAFLHSLVWLD